jgi:hypothetical protein
MIPARLTRPTVGLRPTIPQSAAGLVIEPSVSVPTAAAAPAADRMGGTEVGPLAEIGLAQQQGAGGPQPAGDEGVPRRGLGPDQGQGAGGGGHAVGGVDVVLEQHRQPVQGPAQVARAALPVELGGQGLGLRIELEDRIEPGPMLVDGADPGQVLAGQVDRTEPPGLHGRAQSGQGGFLQGRRPGRPGLQGRGRAQRQRGSAGQAKAQEIPAVDAGGGIRGVRVGHEYSGEHGHPTAECYPCRCF